MNIIAAAIQLTSSERSAENLHKAEQFIDEAARRGARLITLPENFAYLHIEGELTPCAQSLEGPFVSSMKRLAIKHRVYLLCGTIPEQIEGTDQIYNTSVFLDPAGKIIGVYRKVHLFDVSLSGRAEFQESKVVRPGKDIVASATEFGKCGMSICYDLRFPELYRKLTFEGARVIFVPAAFTEYTGKEHWEALLRARAIENQVYVVAPAQFGQHNAKRRSYGKSMIIDPWGTILAKATDKEGVIWAELDFDFQDTVRKELPCLDHVRLR